MPLLLFLALLIPAGLAAAVFTKELEDVFLLAVAGSVAMLVVLRVAMRWVQRGDPAESARSAWLDQPAAHVPGTDAASWRVLRGDGEPPIAAKPEE